MTTNRRNKEQLKGIIPDADYMKWFARFPLRHITSKEQNEAALEVVRAMMTKERLSPDAREYLSLLSEQIAKFEKKMYDMGPKLSATEHLRMMMKEHGLNQTTLAKKLGVTQSNIAHILGGRQRLTVEQIELLSRIFHVSPEIFFETAPVAAHENAISVSEARSEWPTQLAKRREKIQEEALESIAARGQFHFRLDGADIKRLYELAGKRTKPVSTMVREWVLERLSAEETNKYAAPPWAQSLEDHVITTEACVLAMALGGTQVSKQDRTKLVEQIKSRLNNSQTSDIADILSAGGDSKMGKLGKKSKKPN